MSPGAAVTRFVGDKHCDFVALGSHGAGRVLHKSLASYLMQRNSAKMGCWWVEGVGSWLWYGMFIGGTWTNKKMEVAEI